MNENNNEADALFATRRKKQQDEEAQKAAKLAEEERIAELEKQKQQVAEEIKRLETLQALQKEQEEKQALLEQQAVEEKAKKKADKAPFDIKKYLPFILIGAGVLVVAIVVIIVVASSSKSGKKGNSLSTVTSTGDWYRETNSESGLTYVYPSIFSRTDNMDFGESYEVYYYYDEESTQRLIMAVAVEDEDPGVTLLFSNEEMLKYTFSTMMEDEGVKNYTYKKHSDEITYATSSFEDVDDMEDMISIIAGKNDGVFLETYFYVSKNPADHPRNIDFEDLLYIFEKMLDHIYVG